MRWCANPPVHRPFEVEFVVPQGCSGKVTPPRPEDAGGLDRAKPLRMGGFIIWNRFRTSLAAHPTRAAHRWGGTVDYCPPIADQAFVLEES